MHLTVVPDYFCEEKTLHVMSFELCWLILLIREGSDKHSLLFQPHLSLSFHLLHLLLILSYSVLPTLVNIRATKKGREYLFPKLCQRNKNYEIMIK